MIVVNKCLYLKKRVKESVLESFGFKTYNGGDSYVLRIDNKDSYLKSLTWYKDTRRFIFKYPRNARYKTVLRYIPEGLKNKTEVKRTAIWVKFFGWVSREKIDNKVNKVQRRLDQRYGK